MPSRITLLGIQIRVFHQILHKRQCTCDGKLMWCIIMAFSLASHDVHLSFYACYNCRTKICYQQLFYIHIAAYATLHKMRNRYIDQSHCLCAHVAYYKYDHLKAWFVCISMVMKLTNNTSAIAFSTVWGNAKLPWLIFIIQDHFYLMTNW